MTLPPLFRSEKAAALRPLLRVMLLGFLLRLLALICILFVCSGWTDPYFISDDRQYELIAALYLHYASSAVDLPVFYAIGAGDYLTVFWPWVLCISSYLFRTIYAGRVINLLLSTLTIGVVYQLTAALTDDPAIALRASRLFAYLPVTVLTCCFPIKDIFLTFATLCVFLLLVRLEKGKPIPLRFWLLDLLLCVAIYFTRGAVLELLLLSSLFYLLKRCWDRQNRPAALLCIAAGLILIILFRNELLSAFQTKASDYASYGESGTPIALFRMERLSQFYKLPFAYFFATLQPMRTNLFSASTGSSFWLSVIGLLDLTLYPIAVGNFLYIFSPKKNLLFWLTANILYIAVISLSLGIFRHYLFLLPVQLIHYSIEVSDRRPIRQRLRRAGTAALLLLMVVYSCLQCL